MNFNQNNFQNNNFQNNLNFRSMPPTQNMPIIPNISNIPNMQNFQMSLSPSFMNLSLLKAEFDNLNSNPISHFGLSIGLMQPNNYTKWRIILSGPRDSQYAGGLFKINIIFPNNYPNSPPMIYFLNPIYHLNVNPYTNQRDPLGYVPIDKLNLWQPGYTMKETITNLYALFYYEDPNFGYGNDRINEYRREKSLYREKVKYFVDKYAKQNNNFNLDWGNIDWNFRIY